MANPNTANVQDPNEDIPEEFAFTSIAREDGPTAKEDVVELSDEDLMSGEDYFKAKGIDVIFPRTDGSTTKGKLIKWPEKEEEKVGYLVAGLDGKDPAADLDKDPAADLDRDELVGKELNEDEVAKLFKLNPFLRATLVKMRTSKEAREKLTSIFEDVMVKPVRGQEINNGGNAETLEAAIHTFELPGGIEGVAATSKAGYLHATEIDADGKEVVKDRNEDAWLIDPETGFVGVFDGMGGGKNGMRAVETTATAVANNQTDVPAAAKSAQNSLAADPEIGKGDGACFLTVKPELGKSIEVNQCGDVDLYHLSASGEIKYEPGQQLDISQQPQSAFEFLDQVNSMNLPEEKKEAFIRGLIKSAKGDMNEVDIAAMENIVERILSGKRPVVERDNALFTSLRRMVVNGLSQKQSSVASYETPSPVEAGDWILLMSDGVSDNFLEGEIRRYVVMAIQRNWTPEQLTQKISQVLDERIMLAAKNDPLAKQNHYKLDNATIVVMRTKKPVAEATAVAA